MQPLRKDKKMKNAITKFMQDEKGLTTVEYAVAGGVIAAAVATAFTDLAGAVATSIGAIETVIS
jgi:pilus assembly protein Flp/PilA